MEGKITTRSLLLGALFSALFAAVTSYFLNRNGPIATACQIAILPYVLLVLMTILINPLCRLLRIVRAYTVTEILIVFIMGSVSAGISTFGLASQLVPVVSSLFNQHWNNDQTEWNRYVEPFLKESWFISEPGIQSAAQEYRSSLLDLKDAQARYEQSLIPEDSGEAGSPGATARLAALSETIRGLEERMTSSRDKLRALETKAFEKVEVFRRGLPDDMRSFPGFMILPDESMELYFGRIKRLAGGLLALGPLKAFDDELQDLARDIPLPPDKTASLEEAVISAVGHLKPLCDTRNLAARKESLDRQWDGENERSLVNSARLVSLRSERWTADPSEFRTIDAEIDRLRKQSEDLERAKTRTSRTADHVQIQLDAAGKVASAVRDLEALRAAATAGGTGLAVADVRRRLADITARFPSFDASMRRFVIGEAPWRHWIGPLARWTILIAVTYVVLMAFNVLIFRQWAHNERLIYPLAELPKALCGADSETPRALPRMFVSGLFWTGFSVSAMFVGWNLLAGSNLIPGIAPIDFNISWQPYTEGSVLKGLTTARSSVFFVMIGLAFLIPAEISFSLWFFTLVYMAQALILIWGGYGVSEGSFPMEWWYTLNFRTSEGFGALLVFALVVLHKCRRYLFCCIGASPLGGLEPAERSELRTCSFLFLAGSAALILMIWQGMGASLLHTVLGYAIIIVITIGLVRAVTEGGILGFQAWAGPFHFIRTIFGMDKAWTSPSLFAPFFVYYSVLFLDIKTFIAPAMANSIKIRDDLKMGRLRFHVAVASGIGIAAVVAVTANILTGYDRGADSMQGWFYSVFAPSMFDTLASMQKHAPVDHTANSLWMGFGGAAMGILLFLRRTIFWLPHPIGLVMLVNPIMNSYWFSILLGWLAKRTVTRYGNKDAYASARNFFIGLITGEIFIAALSMLISAITGLPVGVDLNRGV